MGELEAFGRRTFGDELMGGVATMGNPKGLESAAADEQPFDPKQRIGAQNWHADRDALPRWGRPLDTPYVVMVHVPRNPFPGHTTSFASLRAAYANLSPERRAWFENQRGWFLTPFGNSKKEDPRVLHPLVHRQPFTGAHSLYVGGANARCILQGMEEEPDDTQTQAWQSIVAEAVAAAGEENVYDHVWEEGDIVIWDNTQVLHRANPYDKSRYVREAYRLGVVYPKDGPQ